MPVTDALSGPSTAQAPPNAFSDLTSEEFVKIMFTELGNQDPLKPNDSNQLLEQMSNLRSIQSDLELTTKLDSMLTQNQFATAGALIGKGVLGFTDRNERVAGVVESVSRTKDGPILNLHNGYRIPFDSIDELVDPPAATPPAATPPATNPPATTPPATTPPANP